MEQWEPRRWLARRVVWEKALEALREGAEACDPTPLGTAGQSRTPARANSSVARPTARLPRPSTAA